MKLLLLALLLVPTYSFAQIAVNGTLAGESSQFFSASLLFISEVIVPFILSIGFLVFVWGMFQYFILGGANDEAKESGKSLIMYAIAGFVIILSFWGIVNIVSNGIGLGGESNKLDGTPSIVPVQ